MLDVFLILILLFFVLKIFVFGPLLYYIFRDDIRAYFEERRNARKLPACPGCGSRYADAMDDGVTRWEGEDLVLVTTYQCQHCHYPFWHVERVQVSTPQHI